MIQDPTEQGSGSASDAMAAGQLSLPLDQTGFFFVAPRRRYSYYVPKGMQGKGKGKGTGAAEGGGGGSANGKKRTNTGPRGAKTSPFVSLWLCWAGSDPESKHGGRARILVQEQAARSKSEPGHKAAPVDLCSACAPAAPRAAAPAARPPPVVACSL